MENIRIDVLNKRLNYKERIKKLELILLKYNKIRNLKYNF
jgi:hypothetical protein